MADSLRLTANGEDIGCEAVRSGKPYSVSRKRKSIADWRVAPTPIPPGRLTSPRLRPCPFRGCFTVGRRLLLPAEFLLAEHLAGEAEELRVLLFVGARRQPGLEAGVGKELLPVPVLLDRDLGQQQS